MSDFIFSLLLGIGPGAVFAILAVGLVIAYRGSGVINFSHGAIAMYTALTFNRIRTEPRVGGSGDIFLPWVDIIPEWGWLKALGLNNLPVRIGVGSAPLSTPVAVAIAVAMAMLIGVLAHLLVFRPLRHASPLSKVVASVGIMIYLQAVAVLHFGTGQKSDLGWGPFTPSQEPVKNFLGLGSNLPRASIWLLIAGVVVAIVAWSIIRFTRFGLAARAVDENERGMALLGYSADAVAGTTWVMSSVIAGLVGIVYVGFTQPQNMTLFIVPALGAALVGNLTSIPAAAAGGIGIAMIQSGGVWLAARESWPDWAPAAGVRQVVPLLIVAGVLYFRGDKLPVRGSLVSRGEPRAPVPERPLRTLGIGLAFIVFLLLVSGWQIESGLTTTLVAGIFMLSLVVLVGFLGQISLAQWSLAGLAAFAMVRFAADGSQIRPTDLFVKDGLGLPDPVAAILAVGVAVIAGVVIGLPAVRLRGFQLAVISITAVIAIEDLLLANDSIMGAGATTNNPAPIPEWFGIYVGAQRQIDTPSGIGVGSSDNLAYSVLVVIIAGLCALAVTNLRRGLIGRRFLAVRSNERAAAAAAIDVGRTKLLGFAIASGLAGVSGVLFVYKLPAISANNFGLFSGLGLLAFVYIAGITTVPGAFVGGVLVSGGLLAAISGSDSGSALFRYTPLIGAFGLLAAALMANGEGVLRLGDRRDRWRERWNDREAEREAWGPSGRIPIFVLGGIAMADFVARGVLPIALDDLQDQFGFSDTQAGLLPFADVLAGALVVVFAGYLADRVKRTRLLTILMVVWAATSALTGAIQRFAHLFTLRVALGMMTTVDDPASSSLIADYYPARLRHKAFSWRLVAPILGGAFGTLAAGIAIDQAGWRWSFVVGAIPAAVLIFFVARLPEPERGAHDEEEAAPAAHTDPADGPVIEETDGSNDDAIAYSEVLRRIVKIKSLPLLIAASALSFGPAVGVTFWAPTFLRRHHDLTAGEAAGLFGFAALAGALIGAWVAANLPERLARPEPGAGPLDYVHAARDGDPRDEDGNPLDAPDPARVRRMKLWIAAIGAEIGVALLMLAYSPTPVSLKFPFLVFGAAGLVAAGPILASLISEVTPANIRGSVFSANAFCRLVLSALTPLAIGFIADQVTFVDRDVPVAIVDDQAIEDRADRYECVDGRVLLGDNADDDDRPGINNYECGDDEVGHLGAGMVTVLSLGALSGFAALVVRRHLEHDIETLRGSEPADVTA